MKKKNIRYLFFFNTAAILKSFLGLIRAKLTSVWLGVEGVGVLGQIATAFNLQANISDLGIYPLLINKLGEYDPEANEKDIAQYFSLSIMILAASNILIVPLILIFREQLTLLLFGNSSYTGLIILMAFISPVYTISMFPETITRSFRKFKILAIGQNLTSLIGLISIIPMLWLFGLKGIVYDLFIYLFFNSLFFAIFAFRLIPSSWFKIKKIKKRILYETFKFCSIMTLRKTITFFALIVFRIIIVQEMGLKDNGYFQSAWSISNYLNVLFTAFVTYLFPTLSNIKDKRIFNKELNDNLKYLLYLIFPFILIIMAIPEVFLTLLFNSQYLPMKYSLNILTFLKLWEAFYIFYAVTFVTQNKLKIFLLSEIVKSGILVVVSSYSISLIGINGAILSIVISDILSILVIIIVTSKDPLLRLTKENEKYLFMFSLISALMIFPIGKSLWLRIGQEVLGLSLFFYFVDLNKYKLILKLLLSKKDVST